MGLQFVIILMQTVERFGDDLTLLILNKRAFLTLDIEQNIELFVSN